MDAGTSVLIVIIIIAATWMVARKTRSKDKPDISHEKVKPAEGWQSSDQRGVAGTCGSFDADEMMSCVAFYPEEGEHEKIWPDDDDEKIELTSEHENIFNYINKDAQLILVTGKAGTGKSTLISNLRYSIEKKMAVVAPTGVAALNCRGKTIHSFFHFRPGLFDSSEIRTVFNRALYEEIDLLVIDEISMVRADLMDSINIFMRKNGRHPDRPFGGAQVLMVGDLFQLPPIVDDEVNRDVIKYRYHDVPYFFAAHAFSGSKIYHQELTKVFRQKDEYFIGLLDNIRKGLELGETLRQINSQCLGQDLKGAPVMTLTPTNKLASLINRERLSKLPGESILKEAKLNGDFDINRIKTPSPKRLLLKNGAQVMFTKNKHPHWVNGTLGTVREICEDHIKIEISNGSCYDVQQEVWENIKYKYDAKEDKIKHEIIGEFIQFPLLQAWAITIHKSQGKTLDAVEIDIGSGAFAPGQAYVALSRCTSIDGVRLINPISEKDILVDSRIRQFQERLKSIN